MSMRIYLLVGMMIASMAAAVAMPLKPAVSLQKVDLFVDGQRALHVENNIGVRISALIANNGYALVPLSFIQDNLNNPVDLRLWNWGIAQISDKHGTTITIKLNDKVALVSVDGKPDAKPTQLQLPVAPLVYEYGIVYVPTPIVEQLGHTVRWDAATHSIQITKREEKEQPKTEGEQ